MKIKKGNFLSIPIISVFILFFCLFLISFYIFYLIKNYHQSQIGKAYEASEEKMNSLNLESLSSLSRIKDGKNTIKFSLYKEKGYLYKSKNTGPASVWEFLNNVSQIGGYPLPPNLTKNLKLIRYSDSSKEKYLIQNNLKLNTEHYLYQQLSSDVPVYGATLAIHTRNVNDNQEIYYYKGNLIKRYDQFPPPKISEAEAKTIVLNQAEKETKKEFPLITSEAKHYVLNLNAIGLSNDPNNYDTAAIIVKTQEHPITFSKRYFVDLSTGKIIHTEKMNLDVLDRIVADYQSYDFQTGSYSRIRHENDPIMNIFEVDQTFNALGKTYQYFFNNFGRDSYDNKGSQLKAIANISCGQPYAGWVFDESEQYMDICQGMSADDVIAHEYTHGVTISSANLLKEFQAGSLSESISDIFAHGVDNSDWTFGEKSVKGPMRYLDDPTKKQDPDRLFSNYYDCNEQDRYHKNAGVFNKAFYLMSEGGNFNGCKIHGINSVDPNKSYNILYHTLTAYLTPNSSFGDMYINLLIACQNLYPDEIDSTCEEVKKSLQATEMDQQPDGEQRSVKCLGIPPQLPNCSCAPKEGFCEYPDSCLNGIISDVDCDQAGPGFLCCRKNPIPTPMKPIDRVKNAW